MRTSSRQAWVLGALTVGVVYLLIGIAFAAPHAHVRVWRLTAWVVSGAVYAAHIGYECVQQRSVPRTTALHTALAAAFGALGLAVVGALHSFMSTSAIRPVWFLALVLWPVITGVPAYLVSLVAAFALTRFLRGALTR